MWAIGLMIFLLGIILIISYLISKGKISGARLRRRGR